MIEIEKLTTWTTGREIRTQNGPRILRKGPLTAEYRAAWRANKEEMKKVGLSMCPVDRNNTQGDWEAIWWQPINGEVAKERDAAVEASRATDAAVDIPVPDGLAYMPFQKAGIAFAMGKPGVLLADEMGLGKTIQAIGIINADPSIKRVLVVCPASLKTNWRNELNKWLVRPARVAIQNSGQPWAGSVADIIVINYDILGKFTRQLMSETWDLLVADECQYAKNPQAQRTKLLVGAQRKADREKYPGIRAARKVAATGTPILNKPVELFPILDYIAPGQWGFRDKIRYCNGYKGRWGWDFTGHAHEEEFQRRLRSTCFVGTTIVESERGPIQIRDIARQLPVRVWSADSMGRVSLKSVVGVRAKENRQILIEIRFAGGKIRCTPDHRVFTQRGYIRADRITGADSLFFLRKEGYQDSNRNPCTIEAGHRARLLNDVRRETQTETPQGSIPEKFRFASKSHSESVPTVQVGIHGQECASVSGPDILHSFMPWEKHSEQTKFSRGDSKKSHVESEADYAETTATAWIDGETTPALRVIDSREFAEAPRPGASAIVRRACDSRGTNGRSHDSQWQSGIRGHSVAGKDVGCRSGRSDSCGKKTANQGQREGQITEWIGVLSAESVAMGNRGGASGCGSEDNVVYDIEVADNHNFFANGVLVHNCMLRRLKKDVLTELPAKRRQIIELDAGDAASLCAEEVDLYDGNSDEIEAAGADKALAEAADDEEAYKNAVARLRSAQKVAFERISKVRHEVALAKVEQAVDHIMDVLESTPKLVVFAHHLDVIARIEQELTERLQAEGSASDPVCVVTGQTPVGERQAIVDRFNGDPSKRALILGIHAAGVGLSVKASVEVFVELDWVPGIISQAEDRCLLEKSLVCYRRPAIMSGMSLTAIENIREGDEVLTEAGKFAKVLRVHQHSEHHPMVTEIEYVGWHEPLRCTYDHAIFVKRDGKNRWVLAHELLPNDSMVFPKMADCTPLQYVEIKKEWRLYETGQKSKKCVKCGASQIEARSMCRACYRKEIHSESRPQKPMQINSRYVRLPDHIEINDEWLYLFGWYAAEGFASISPGKSRFVSFSGHKEEEPTLRRIEKTINALGIKCGLYRNRKTKGIELRAYSGELALWFRDWFGHTAAHKKLPDVLTEVSSEQSAIILRGYTDGDGCRRSHSDGKSVEVRWSSKSQQLSWQMAMLAVKAGFIPRMKVEGDQQWAGAYTDGRCGNKRLREQDNEFIYRPIRSVKTERVKDHKWVKLYDLTVEGDHHSFTVGFATVHNCHGIGRGIEGEPLLVQHLVLEGSLDSRMAKIVVAKQDMADRMLDKDMAKLANGEPVTALDIEFDADKIRREDAKAEDPELHDVVLRGLQMLAGVCDGAAMRDDMGFNGCDARIGHSLARLSRLSPKQVALGRRLLIKYRRQLPDDVNAKVRDNE